MTNPLKLAQALGENPLPVKTLASSLPTILEKSGYTSDNTLIASTHCRDELNHRGVEAICSPWGSPFNLSGLAGIPAAGNTAFAAFSHHVETDQKLFILYGPHIGLTPDGKWGEVQRMRMKKTTTSCGALCLALKQLDQAAPVPGDQQRGVEEDWEQWVVYHQLDNWIKQTKAQNDLSIIAATKLMSNIIHQQVTKRREVAITPEYRVAMLGGVMINTPHNDDDLFVPHYFTAEMGDERPLDLIDQL